MSNLKTLASFWQKQCFYFHRQLSLGQKNHQSQHCHYILYRQICRNKTIRTVNDVNFTTYRSVEDFIKNRLIQLLAPSQSGLYSSRRFLVTKKGIEPETKNKFSADDISSRAVKKIDSSAIQVNAVKQIDHSDIQENAVKQIDCSAIQENAVKQIDHSAIQENACTLDDDFSEIFSSVEQTYGTTLKESEWQLYSWGKIVAEKKEAKEEINLDRIVSHSIYSLTELVLTPSAPLHMRVKLLALLLNDKNDREITKKILSKTLSEVNTLPVSAIAVIIQELTVCSETPLRKDVRLHLVQAVVNKRWQEIPAKYIVLFLYQLDSLFDMRDITQKCHGRMQESKQASANETASAPLELSEGLPVVSVNLESRVLSLVDELKTKDLAKVMVLLSKWKNRNQTILNAVIYRLITADFSDFSFVQLNKLLLACSVLNYRNERFLTKLTDEMFKVSPPDSSPLSSSVLTSLSHIRWRNNALITACKKNIFDDLNILSARDAKNTLLSLANLVEMPCDQKEINSIKELASTACEENFLPYETVTYNWCLAVLKCLPSEQANNLLKPDFVQQLTASCDGYVQQIALQRLAVINLAAKYEISGFKGVLPPKNLLESIEVSPFCTDKALVDTFEKAIGKFADMNTYVLCRQVLQDNVRADYIMIANKNGDVRPVKQAEQGNEKVYRLALQLVPFSALIGPMHTPVGSYTITARFLRHLGYIPVHITYLDLKPTQGVLEHINNITAKIKLALGSIQD